MCVLILLFALSFAHAENTCPDVTPVRDFDFDAYGSGTWYEIGRLPNPLESGTCVVMNGTRLGSGFQLQVSEVDNRTRDVYEGILLHLDPEQNLGELDYIFEGYEVVMKVLAVNYTSYAVEYNCWYNETTGEMTEQGWIMSRTPDLVDITRDDIIELLKEYNVTSTDKIIWDDFSEESCGYDSQNINTTLPGDLEQKLD